jgi:hypothetical protein
VNCKHIESLLIKKAGLEACSKNIKTPGIAFLFE